MTWFRLRNNSPLPVNAAISWGGIIQHYKNNIPGGGGYAEWNVPGLGWHDIKIVPANGDNQFDPSKDNLSAIGQWALGAVGVAIAAGGLVLIPFTAGASTGVTVAGIGIAAGGAVITASDIVIAGINAALYPVSVSGLYGPDGYNFEVGGGEIVGTYDKDGKVLTVTQFKPLMVKWTNNKTHATGTETASH